MKKAGVGVVVGVLALLGVQASALEVVINLNDYKDYADTELIRLSDGYTSVTLPLSYFRDPSPDSRKHHYGNGLVNYYDGRENVGNPQVAVVPHHDNNKPNDPGNDQANNDDQKPPEEPQQPEEPKQPEDPPVVDDNTNDQENPGDIADNPIEDPTDNDTEQPGDDQANNDNQQDDQDEQNNDSSSNDDIAKKPLDETGWDGESPNPPPSNWGGGSSGGSSGPSEPVPEPGTMLMIGSGLVGLAGFRFWKRKK